MSSELMKRIQKQGEMWARSGMRFLDEDRIQEIIQLSEQQLDEIEYGVVKIDDRGVIEIYNKEESERANVAKNDAIGKNFFTQIAPCTNNGIFYGSFKNGLQTRQLDLIFPYTFTYKMKPTPVKIHLYRNQANQSNWIFVNWN